MNSYQENDLDWLAFRYVAGEMTDAECASFEARLADDQIALEAVAAAVELSDILMKTTGELTPASLVELPARQHWLRPAAWMTAGAAACLLAVLGAQFFLGHANHDPDLPLVTNGNTAHRNLALLWSEMRHSSASVPEESEPETFEIAIESDSLAGTDMTEDAEEETPSWITAAVSSLAKPKKNAEGSANKSEEL